MGPCRQGNRVMSQESENGVHISLVNTAPSCEMFLYKLTHRKDHRHMYKIFFYFFITDICCILAIPPFMEFWRKKKRQAKGKKKTLFISTSYKTQLKYGSDMNMQEISPAFCCLVIGISKIKSLRNGRVQVENRNDLFSAFPRVKRT